MLSQLRLMFSFDFHHLLFTRPLISIRLFRRRSLSAGFDERGKQHEREARVVLVLEFSRNSDFLLFLFTLFLVFFFYARSN